MSAPVPATPDLAAAEQPKWPTLADAEALMRPVGGRWVPQGISGLLMAEYDRMKAARTALLQLCAERDDIEARTRRPACLTTAEIRRVLDGGDDG